jgi:hypothetical protein
LVIMDRDRAGRGAAQRIAADLDALVQSRT